jgi:hypothetical protein
VRAESASQAALSNRKLSQSTSPPHETPKAVVTTAASASSRMRADTVVTP